MRIPLMAAYGYQAKSLTLKEKSLYIHNPSPELSTSENILKLLRPSGNIPILKQKFWTLLWYSMLSTVAVIRLLPPMLYHLPVLTFIQRWQPQ